MHAIFYDLETSDTLPLGQILNYSFIYVDGDFERLAELSGEIRISRLQLPRAGAILANRIDVLVHQQKCSDDELTAMRKIHEFLTQCARSSQAPIALIGFNSSGFDLNFLRTSFIRNGLDPYAWSKKLVERDILLSVRKLALSDSRFPILLSKDDPKKISLRLENLGHGFGILEGIQTHHSRDDVLLTIDLARVLRERFSFDAVSYLAYEGAPCERKQRTPEVFSLLDVNYDASAKERFVRRPWTLLCTDHRCGLWVDLEAYKAGAGRRSVQHVKKLGGHALYLELDYAWDRAWRDIAAKAQAEFSGLNIQNFFTETECDIEVFIYRLDAADRIALAKAIAEADGRGLKNLDARILFRRHVLRAYSWGSGNDDAIERDLRSYALRRYGGEVLLSKSISRKLADTPRAGDYHPTFQMLVDEIWSRRQSAGSAKDTALLDSLERFYKESDIYRVAGEELLARGRLESAA